MSNPTYFIQECPTCGRQLQIRVEYLDAELSANTVRVIWSLPTLPPPATTVPSWATPCSAAPMNCWNRSRDADRSRDSQIPSLSEIPKEVRIRLRRAAGIANRHAGNGQARQRQAHRHPMVVVRVDLGPVQSARRDSQPVGTLLDFRPKFPQFDRQGVNPVGLLMANMGDAADRGRAFGEPRHCRKRLHGIADGVHVDLDSVQWPSQNADAVVEIPHVAAHFSETLAEGHVPLQATAGKALDRHFALRDCRGEQGCISRISALPCEVFFHRTLKDNNTHLPSRAYGYGSDQ